MSSCPLCCGWEVKGGGYDEGCLYGGGESDLLIAMGCIYVGDAVVAGFDGGFRACLTME